MKKRKLFSLFLIIFLLINIIFAVTYYNSKNIFEIVETEVFQEDGEYFVKVKIDSYVGKLYLYSELIYKSENLVINEDNFICNNYCEITLPIKEVFFDKYRINLYTKYKKKYYIEKHSFNLEESEIFLPQVNISLNQNSFLIEDNLIQIAGNILSNEDDFEQVKYLLEIYPLSKPDYRQYYEKMCYGSCSFEFDLEGPYVVDNYQMNLYSIIGETFTNFEIILNSSSSNNQTQEKYNLTNLPNKFIYSNENLIDYNLSFDVGKQEKNLNQISNLDNVNVEITINEGNVKKIFIPDTKIEETNIGFEYIKKEKIDLNLSIENAFAINPQVSSNVQIYNLDFIAQADAVYKCQDYDFENQDCFGNFIKILDTIPGNYYSLSLTPVDPIFVEVWEPNLKVQKGVTISSGTTITQSINIINQSQSLILFEAMNADSAPDDWQFTPDFQDDSTIRFNRYVGTSPTEINWQVLTSNLFKVQRGNEILSIGSNIVNIPISQVNLTESFVKVYGRCNSGQTADNFAGFFTANLTSETNLYLERGNAGECEATVNWQIVEFDGANVKNGNVSFDSSSTIVTETIPSTNRLNSFLIFDSSSVGSDPGMNSNLIRGEISQSNEVTFTRRGSDGTSNRNLFYYVIEHPYLNVQRGFNSIIGATTQAITPITNLNNSFITSSVANSGGGQTYRNYFYYLNFQDDSTLNFDKQTGSQTDDINWEVIEFISPGVDLSNEINITSVSGNNYNQDDLICEFSQGSDVNGVLVNWYKNSNNILDLYLPFEGGSLNYYNDYSDNRLVSSCINCPIWQNSNGFDNNGSFLFDGNNDYLTLNDNSLDLSSGQFSISVWINSQISDNNYHGFFGYDIGNSNQRYPGMWIVNQNQIHLGFGTGSAWCSVTSGNVLSNGWNHLVMTFDGNDLNLYVNGVRQVNYNGCSGTTPFSQSNLNIGRVDNYFQGNIDDVRIYKSVLSNGQIQNLFQNNINELSNEETNIAENWMCKINAFNDLNIGPDYLSNSIIVIDNPTPEINTSANTCSATFSFLCGDWPAASEGDNTFDSCPTSIGNAGDENVREVYINTTSAYTRTNVTVTCDFDPYSTGTEELIYYYNGTSWRELYNTAAPSGDPHNVSVSILLDSFEGEHWFRCIIDWDGENDECADGGSYYDNDDVKVDVYKVPEPFSIDILSPLNQNYSISYILADFAINKLGDLEYSIDGSPFISACTNCFTFNFSQIYRDGIHNLTIKATEFTTSNISFKSVLFTVNSSAPVTPRNTSQRTCSDTFGFFCGDWPAASEGDNTFDTCPSGVGNAGDENVIDVYVNMSSVYFADQVEITCEFDPYSTGTEELIYYYNGTSWTQLYSGPAPGADPHNITIQKVIDNYEGEHWFRCIADWDGENDECADGGSYYDNDDVSIEVINNLPPEIPFVLSILNPLNISYSNSTIDVDFLSSANANISYSINGETFVNICNNCTSYIGTIEASQRNNYLEVRAIHFTNGSVVYSNISFSLDESVDLEPGINNFNLRSSTGLNQTTENLICDYSLNSLANFSVINWNLDGSSITYLNLPFQGNSSNALLDFSGHNNHAILSGNTLWDNNGYFYFDGDNDYLNFGDIPEMDNPSEFSISLWFNRQIDVGDTTNHGIGNVLIGQSSQTNNDNLEIGTIGTNIELYLDTSGTDSMSFDAGIQDNRWYHLVLTYDSTRSNELELYLDGILIQSFNEPSGALSSSAASQLTLGIARPDAGDPSGDFNGFIDNVKIFKSAISEDLILNLANNNSQVIPSQETVEGNNWECLVTAFSSLEKSNTFQSNLLEVLEGSFRGVNLQLKKNITRLDNNKFNVQLNLINLNSVPTPKNQIIKIYGFISNNSILTDRVYTSSSWYNIIESNESISGGQIFQWDILEINSDDSALDRNSGFLNSSNSVNINFNISTMGNYSYLGLMKFGFDPILE